VRESEENFGNGEFVGSKDVRTGYLSGPGFTDKPVRYNVVDGIAIYDGCIDMGPVEEVEAYAAQLEAAAAPLERGGLAPDGGLPTAEAAEPAPPEELKGVGIEPDSTFLWTNGVVPFVVDANLPNPARVTAAINHIHANTGIRFVARTNQTNRVRFVRNGNETFSSSAVGMRGGEQLIRLADGAPMGTIVHECMHALGVLHEQSRCDRDQFVTINYQNILDGFESNFDRMCEGFRDYYEYDYGSIMHYPATAFSRNNQPTIGPKQAGVTIGQRNAMSVIDRLTIAEMYSRFTGRGHSGVWRAGSGRYALWVNVNWESFRAKWQEWAAQGLRLVDIHVRRVGNENRYSGVWTARSGAYGLWANATWDSFRAKWQEWSGQGLRLIDLHVQRVGGQDRYSGVFVAGTGAYGLWVNGSWDSFRAKWQEWAGQGMRLVDINVRNVGGQDRYSGVWLAGSGGYGLWVNASWESFLAKWQQWAGQGLRLADMSVHQVGGANRYSGAFLPGTDAYYLWANVPWESLRARWEQLGAQGLRLIDYEFTESAAADAADIDVAGAPAEPGAAAELPEGAGGIADDTGALDVRQMEIPAAAPTNGEAAPMAAPVDGSGEGGFSLGDEAAAPVADDGLGGAVLAESSKAAPADPADGVGGAVLDESAEAPAEPNGDGDGAAVHEGGAGEKLTA
jgi:Astacin (Peptidase family M12A)/Bacterial tandem repeat domain 1